MAIHEPEVLKPDHAAEDAAEALIRDGRGSARRHRVPSSAVLAAVAGVAAGVYLLAGPSQATGPSSVAVRLTAAQQVPSPGTFALAAMHGHGYELGIYSAETGAMVRRLGFFPSSAFTNNGLAYAPDAHAVYYTLIPKRHTARSESFGLRLMRLDVRSRRSTFVADGTQPAVNGAGTKLAYGAFPRGLAVRDLRTGQTRTISLRQLDGAANLMNAAIGWIGDGTDIAVVPAPGAWDLAGKEPHFRWCKTSQRNSVIVFVHVPPAPAPLSARCVRVPGLAASGRVVIAPDPGSRTSALVTAMAPHGGTVVAQISQDGISRTVATIPDSLPIAFDVGGSHLLYLSGHGAPPVLTEATISAGRAVNGPWRDRHIALGAGAW